MSNRTGYQGIHLTGSLPFANADEVFDFIGSELQPWVTRVPDGETGERKNWVLTQSRHFFENPAFDIVDATATVGRKLVKIKDGVRPEDISFPKFEYAEFATDSYPLFKKAKAEGLDPVGSADGTRHHPGLVPEPTAGQSCCLQHHR
ncbi:hypothetical protein [Hyphomicrobium sp.]|uniref:hypothetical protein n=1 Tax=Hyphomicrobium sp. TaxID=82 RepID=UPI002D778EE0|nr:hypothetical protein [Hyphomicrobium sp.]HET6388565.1 hypothetical protein [Hyphomicrobium sp.]